MADSYREVVSMERENCFLPGMSGYSRAALGPSTRSSLLRLDLLLAHESNLWRLSFLLSPAIEP